VGAGALGDWGGTTTGGLVGDWAGALGGGAWNCFVPFKDLAGGASKTIAIALPHEQQRIIIQRFAFMTNNRDGYIGWMQDQR
jgi:hypothetical protein